MLPKHWRDVPRAVCEGSTVPTRNDCLSAGSCKMPTKFSEPSGQPTARDALRRRTHGGSCVQRERTCLAREGVRAPLSRAREFRCNLSSGSGQRESRNHNKHRRRSSETRADDGKRSMMAVMTRSGGRIGRKWPPTGINGRLERFADDRVEAGPDARARALTLGLGYQVDEGPTVRAGVIHGFAR